MPEVIAKTPPTPVTATPPAATAKPVVAPAPAAAAAPAPRADVAPKADTAPKAAATPAPAAPATIKPTKPAPKPVAKKAAAAKRAAPQSKTPRKPAAKVLAAPKMKDIKMDTIKAAADKAQDQAKTMFADVNSRAKGAMEKSSKMVEEMNAFGKGNVEAMVEASKIYAKGVESMGQDAAAFAKKQYEDATAAIKSMTSVKSPTEFFKLQSDFARASFDAMVAHTSKSTEKMIKLAGEVAQPISNRASLAAEKIKIAA